MEHWQTLSRPGLRLRLRYPSTTPQGHPVDVLDETRDGVVRVHLTSRGSVEVYFEVRRFFDLTPNAEYERARASLAERFAGDDFAITSLTSTVAAGLPAHTYTFRWTDKARAVVLLPHSTALYRLIYDPLAPLNADLLATISLT